MRAWVLERQAKIEERPLKLVEDYPDPEPSRGQIRIKVKSCGICRTDLHIAEGDLPLHKSPVILGHEIAGIVDKVGEGVRDFKVGDRAGLTWLYSTCGNCKYCTSGRENYCPNRVRTGWDVDGGFAEYVVAQEGYALNLNGVPLGFDDLAPLMCPGVASYLAFELASPKPGDRLGIIGFGPTAYYLTKIANGLGIEVYVSTRAKRHRELAEQLGAAWIGNLLEEAPPRKLDCIVSFPPIGEAVERALEALNPGGTLVLAQVASTPITIGRYENLWGRTIKTVYNVKRSTSRAMVELAKRIDMSIEKRVFGFEELQDAMIEFRKGRIEEMTSVLKVSP